MLLRSTETEAYRRIPASQSVGERITLPTGDTVIVGLPPKKGWDMVYGGDELHVPITPHVFTVSELRIGTTVLMNNVVVLAAHGERTGDNEWRFSNGALVVSTVLDYNQHAVAHNRPLVQAVVVCNSGNGTDAANRSSELVEQGIIFPISGSIYPHLTVHDGKVSLLVSQGPMYRFANLQM